MWRFTCSLRRAKKLKITHVTETHIHADYASGATALAEATGAELWLSGHDATGKDKSEDYSYAFAHREFWDGDVMVVGGARLRAIHTPGHTPEHLSFVLYEGVGSEQPLGVFTGDFVMPGSLGRPDLLGEAAKGKLAHALYRSAHTGAFAKLPDGVTVYPAHGAGSLCGAGMVERPESSLGYERATNRFLKIAEEEEFCNEVLRTVPEFPAYYRRMKALNARGARVLKGVSAGEELDVAAFRERVERGVTQVLDVRRAEGFGGAHVTGALNIGLGPQLAPWAAWVLDYERPILLVGDDSTKLEEAVVSLRRVGLDAVEGYLQGGMPAWMDAGEEIGSTPQVSVKALAAAGREGVTLDVRNVAEWKAGHIAGAMHVPASELEGRMAEVPQEQVTVICGSGYRSSLAASLLRRAGRKRVRNVVGGMGAWQRQRLPVVV